MGDPQIEHQARNGQQIGADYAETLTRYLANLRSETKGLPARNGKVSTSAVALACGIDRQSLYKNPRCRELLEEAVQELGIQGIETRIADATIRENNWKEQRILNLEQQVVSLQAEIQELRRQIIKYAHIEKHMIETGRRVIL